MGERHFFWLYRPTFPSVRAQSIQILHAALAMAERGHHVQLVAEAEENFVGGTEEVYRYYGVDPHPKLNLVLLRGGRTRKSLIYRAYLSAFVLKYGHRGVLISRSKKHAIEARRFFGKRPKIVLETHELDSALARERGEQNKHWVELEHAALNAADAVIANAPGTLELWKRHYVMPPSTVLQNATRSERVRHPSDSASGVAYVGSARGYKDLETVVRLAKQCEYPVTWIGGTDHPLLVDSAVHVMAEIPHAEVPDYLCTFRVLLLPLSKGVFGEKLSSPLKLWDYMAAGVPIVGADVESLRKAAPGAYIPYTAGDVKSLQQAVEQAYTDEGLRRKVLGASFVRTWSERAVELESFLESVL